VPTSRDPETPPLDIPGAVLSIVALSSLVWSIISAGERGWTGTGPLTGFAIAAVAGALFVAWERHTPHPMLDVTFFQNARFTAASLGVMLGYFAMFGALFLMSQLLQFVLGYSALDAGVRLLPLALAMAAISPVSTALVDRFGTKTVVAGGMGLLAVSLLWLATRDAGSTYFDYLPGLVFMGLGVGLTWAPATESVMGSLPAAKAGVGSAVNDTVREVGGALGIAVIGSVLASQYTESISSTTAALPADAAHVAGDSLGGAVMVAQQMGGTAGAAVLEAAQTAFVDGFGLALTVAAVVAAAGAAVAAIWLPSRATEAQTVEPELAEDLALVAA
jgi:Na+/melibiose symporter-like transporter